MNARRCRGFTLIEVMIALTIVALALATITVSMGQMVDNGQTLRDRTYASWIAQNRIAELRLAFATPDVGVTRGEVQYANAEWSWRATVAETGVDDLYRIDVAVSYAGSDEIIRTVTGFVGPPGAPGEANRAWMRIPGPQAPGPGDRS